MDVLISSFNTTVKTEVDCTRGYFGHVRDYPNKDSNGFYEGFVVADKPMTIKLVINVVQHCKGVLTEIVKKPKFHQLFGTTGQKVSQIKMSSGVHTVVFELNTGDTFDIALGCSTGEPTDNDTIVNKVDVYYVIEKPTSPNSDDSLTTLIDKANEVDIYTDDLSLSLVISCNRAVDLFTKQPYILLDKGLVNGTIDNKVAGGTMGNVGTSALTNNGLDVWGTTAGSGGGRGHGTVIQPHSSLDTNIYKKLIIEFKVVGNITGVFWIEEEWMSFGSASFSSANSSLTIAIKDTGSPRNLRLRCQIQSGIVGRDKRVSVKKAYFI